MKANELVGEWKRYPEIPKRKQIEAKAYSAFLEALVLSFIKPNTKA